MTLNHSKSIKTAVSLLYMPYTKTKIHSRDSTVLIDLLLCTTPACFSTFIRSTMVPTLVENS